MLGEYRKDLPYYVLSKGTTVLSWLFIVWFLTRNLNPEQYGEYSLLYSLMSLFAIITTSWLNSSIYRHLPEYMTSGDVRHFQAIILNLSEKTIAGGAAAFICTLIVIYVSGILPITIAILLSTAFAFACHSAFLLIIGYLSAKRELRAYTFASVGQVVSFAVIVWLLIDHFEHKTLLIFMALALSYLPTIVLALRVAPVDRIDVREYARDYMRYGLPLMVLSSATLINMYGDQFLIRIFSAPADVGVYSANYVFAERSILSLSSVIVVAYLPILFRTWESGAHDEAYRFIWKIVYVLLAVLLPIEFLLVAYGDKIAGFFINERYSSGYNIIPIVGLATILSCVAGVVSDVLTVQKRTSVIAGCYLFAAAVNVLLNVLFIPRFGYMSAAYATLISCCVLLAAVLYYAQKSGGFLRFARPFRKLPAAAPDQTGDG